MAHSVFTRRGWLGSMAALGGAAAASAWALPATRGADAESPDVIDTDVIDIGSRRELFVDDLLIGKLDGVRLKLHEPRPAGVALAFDGPADGLYSYFTTVLKDGGTYRMYYRGRGDRCWSDAPVCYAESGDGIHWTKPKLGLVEVRGTRENNAIEVRGAAFSAFVDTRPGVPPDERFKANAAVFPYPPRLMGYVSGDGIRWRPIQDEPLMPSSLANHFDSQNVMFWSEVERCYVVYARHGVGGKRATARATSADFLNWSDFTLMTYSDTESTVPSEQLYTNQTQPYFRAPHIYVALPFRHVPGRVVLTGEQFDALDVLKEQRSDLADGMFMTTRAGSTRYDRNFHEAFIRPGLGLSNWVSRTNSPACGIVQTGPHEMSLYVQRDYAQPTAHLERMTLRTDGFVSIRAPYDGGELITKPLRFSGNQLTINYSSSAAGGLRVEIQDAAGQALPGFGLADCAEIIGDEIDRVVRWKGGSDVSGVAGQPVRLRFVMKDADLFAIRFRPEE